MHVYIHVHNAYIYVYTCRKDRALPVGGAVPQEEDTVGEATREERLVRSKRDLLARVCVVAARHRVPLSL